MPDSLTHHGQDLRNKMLQGAKMVADTVIPTLGPQGRNVIIKQPYGEPKITKDGATVASSISKSKGTEGLGVEVIKVVAAKSNEVGDGTTTATTVAMALVEEGMKHTVSGNNSVLLRNGIDKACKKVCDHIKNLSKQINTRDEIIQVASISANNDPELGEIIGGIFDEHGSNAVVTVEDGKALTTKVRYSDGMKFDRGFISPYFVTDAAKRRAELANPHVLIYKDKLTTLQPMIPLLEKIAQSGKPFLIIAEDVEGEALTTLVLNKLRGTLNVAAVKAPGFGDKRAEMLQDLAILTGGEVISSEIGSNIENVSLDDLGSAEKIVITKDNTTIVKGAGNKQDISSRCDMIMNQIKESNSDYEKEKLQERYAKLSSGVNVIEVGAATEPEMKERKYRIEDALNATRAAMEEGIVPGGGATLLHAAKCLDGFEADNEQEATGIKIVRVALEAPAYHIAQNAGISGEVVVNKLRESDSTTFGYDARNHGYVDMIKSGIIDPTKVTVSALINACSIAGLFLTTEAGVTEDQDSNDNDNAGGAPGMGGGMGGMGMGGM